MKRLFGIGTSGWLLALSCAPAAAQELEWRIVASKDAPLLREDASVVWTGAELIVWGGQLPRAAGGREYFGDGAAFRPADDGWRVMSTVDAPSARAWHGATWTGEEMIVFGGQDEDERPDAAAYDPRSDCWAALPTAGAPAPRVEASAVWTGAQLLVFGGVTEERSFIGGGRFRPATGAWEPLAPAPLPYGPRSHTAVWTGSSMLVFGGINGSSTLDLGLRYDPREDRWSELSAEGAPAGRGSPTAVWTGTELAVFGGAEDVYRQEASSSGALYDPRLDRWRAFTSAGQPGPRDGHALAWTGEHLLVFGGTAGDREQDDGWLADGALYDPREERWEPLPRAPLALIRPQGAWTPHGLVLVGRAAQGDARWTAMCLAERR